MRLTRSSREASEGDGSHVKFRVFLRMSGRAATTVLADAARRAGALGFDKIGVQHIALQFMVPRWPERREQIERFALDVVPAFQGTVRS